MNAKEIIRSRNRVGTENGEKGQGNSRMLSRPKGGTAVPCGLEFFFLLRESSHLM